MIEQSRKPLERTENPRVPSSILGLGTSKIKGLQGLPVSPFSLSPSWYRISLFLPTLWRKKPEHKAKQAIKDTKRLSEGQKRKVMKDLKGKEGGYEGQKRKTKRTLQGIEKGYRGQKQ